MRNLKISKIYRTFNKEIPFSKIDLGNLSRMPDMPPKVQELLQCK